MIRALSDTSGYDGGMRNPIHSRCLKKRVAHDYLQLGRCQPGHACRFLDGDGVIDRSATDDVSMAAVIPNGDRDKTIRVVISVIALEAGSFRCYNCTIYEHFPLHYNMKTMRLLPLIAMICCAQYVPARQLTPDEALARVPVSRMKQVVSRAGLPSLCFTAEAGGVTTLYAFNSQADGGFMLVSADDAFPVALLGYSDTGSFPTQDVMPPNVRWWMDQYSRQIAMWATGEAAATDDVYPGVVLGAPDVDPIVKTLWNQLSPYNLMCPELNDRHCPTGCVATAMAQVMKVHGWPASGRGSHSYTPYHIGHEVSVDFSASAYQWDKMADNYTGVTDQDAVDAVARLMLDCGVSVSMQYDAGASGANYPSAAKSLVRYFDYDKGIRVLHRDCYDYKDWLKMIYDELAGGRPVMYAGTNDEGSHAFVCDGYRSDDYFHINWGWGGLSDGFFLLIALEPDEQGTGGSSAGYNLGQQLILGIQPPVEGSHVIPVMRFLSNFATGATSYARPYAEVKFLDRRGIFNESIETVSATMGVKLTDGSGAVTYVESTPQRYYAGQGFIKYVMSAEKFPDSGTYTVTPAVKDSTGVWWDCEVNMSNIRELSLTVTADSLVFTPIADATVRATGLKLLSPVYPGREFGLQALLANVSSDEEFYDDVMPVLELDDELKGTADPISVELLAGEKGTFEWVGKFPSGIAPGKYMLYLADSHERNISQGLEVTVEAAPAESTEYTVLSTTAEGFDGSEQTPAQMAASDLRFRVTVSCSSGYFSGIMQGGVFHADGEGIYEVPGGFIGVAAGDTKSIDMNSDMSLYLSSGNLYYFKAYAASYGRIGNNMYFTVGSQGLELVGEETPSLRVVHHPGSDQALLSAPSGIVSVEFYSASGRVVARHYVGGTESAAAVDLTGISQGFYLLRVVMSDGGVGVVKFIRD